VNYFGCISVTLVRENDKRGNNYTVYLTYYSVQFTKSSRGWKTEKFYIWPKKLSTFTMKVQSIVILEVFVLLSVVFCQNQDETYAEVACKPHWGGVICDCENSKYVNYDLMWR
jgi:hypothetical protein